MEIPRFKLTNPKSLFASGVKSVIAIAVAPYNPVAASTQGADAVVKFTESFGKKKKNLGLQAFSVITQSYFTTTGHHDPALIIEGMRLGVRDWFFKPFELSELLLAINRLVPVLKDK